MRLSAATLTASQPDISKIWVPQTQPRRPASAAPAGRWQTVYRSPNYTSQATLARSMVRPQSASSLLGSVQHSSISRGGGGSAASLPRSLSMFGFSAPVVQKKSKMKVPARIERPSRDATLKIQLWEHFATLERRVAQWLAADRLASVAANMAPSSLPLSLPSSYSGGAEDSDDGSKKVERCESAQAEAEEALASAKEELPQIAEEYRAARSALEAAEAAPPAKPKAPAKPKKGVEPEPEPPDPAAVFAAAELKFQQARQAVPDAQVAVERAIDSLRRARQEREANIRSMELLVFDRQLRETHERVTSRPLPCRLPYVLKQVRARHRYMTADEAPLRCPSAHIHYIFTSHQHGIVHAQRACRPPYVHLHISY